MPATANAMRFVFDPQPSNARHVAAEHKLKQDLPQPALGAQAKPSHVRNHLAIGRAFEDSQGMTSLA
jgi:hypothetical protein